MSVLHALVVVYDDKQAPTCQWILRPVLWEDEGERRKSECDRSRNEG